MGEVFVCHIDDGIAFTECVAPWQLETKDYYIQKYTVESLENLLVVSCFRGGFDFMDEEFINEDDNQDEIIHEDEQIYGRGSK